MEEAKLLWAQGQQAVAVSMSRSLLEGARQNKQHDMLAYARLLSLTGKWLAETRQAMHTQCANKSLNATTLCNAFESDNASVCPSLLFSAQKDQRKPNQRTQGLDHKKRLCHKV